MFIPDQFNNVGRHCTIGTGEGRVWQVRTAVSGHRYLVRNYRTGEFRTVSHRAMSNLY